MEDKYFSTPKTLNMKNAYIVDVGVGGEYFTFNFNLNQVHTFTYIRGTVQKICGQKPNFGHSFFAEWGMILPGEIIKSYL